MNPDQIEEAVKANNLNAPRVSKDDLEANIVHTEVVKHVTFSGKVLRWAVLTTRNGFAVTGNPSASVSIENDHAPTGESVAIANAKSALWPLMGYALAEKLATASKHQEFLSLYGNMSPYQQRAVEEYSELYDRHAELAAFLAKSPAADNQLEAEEMRDLKEQLEAMHKYIDILHRRISRF